MEQNHVFDSARQVEIQLCSAEGARIVKVRFPTDEEWVERQLRRKILIKQLGRGVSETTIPNAEEVDAALFRRIRLDDGEEIDAYEASRIIEQLS